MKALFVIDMLNDFVNPMGALYVKGAEGIIENVKMACNKFQEHGDRIFFLNDAHDPKDPEFNTWPVHCVKGTKGAEIVPELNFVYEKNAFINKVKLSGFSNPVLDETLLNKNGWHDWKIDEIYVCGVATDFCVLQTVIDSLDYGYKTTVLVDAIKGVDLKFGDCNKALMQMGELGAKYAYVNVD